MTEQFFSSMRSAIFSTYASDVRIMPGGVMCSSVEEMQEGLHAALNRACTPTHAQNITVTFQFPLDAIFTITHDEAQEPLDLCDASQQEGLLPSAPQRQITASHVVLNQRPDDISPQKIVANHLAANVGDVDLTQWPLKDITWDQQGWVVSYICAHSMQHWQTQVDGMKKKPLMAEFAHKELEPIMANRPAYDCLGVLTITFSTAYRSILVNYCHTPLHKSVAEILALLVPTPAPAPAGPIVPILSGKGQRRRRTKSMTVGPDGEPHAQENIPKRRRKRKTAEPTTKSPTPPIDAPTTADTAFGAIDSAGAQSRRDTAQAMLAEAGVDHTTLSEDQFAILANQAPDLQQESVAMLKQYGAQMLRIVYQESTPSTATTQSWAEAETQDATTGEQQAAQSSPKTKRRTRLPRKSKDLEFGI
ncbi:hypothetical protein BROUX41_005973 [Berkeleyomyces rouxiae]|uniref:uncharacterized protein n=1 Tax=Berkeleyomyces rouxiae TaxID=2035830 RepID=UPI003B7E89E3